MSPSFIDSLAGLGLVSAAMDLVAKATIVLVLAWLIAALLHRSSAAVRHRLWSLRSAASSSCRSSAGPSLAGDCRSCR